RDRARGLRVARALRVGGVSINDSLSHFGVAGLPMGGVGDSGFGRRRGVEGLEEMTRVRTVFVDRLGLKREPWWFPYDERGRRLTRAVLAWRAHGGIGGLLRAAWRLLGRGA
ncbi:MAG: aldehyde dehydrogenase family protein, partial [Longimicrobiales bacterium]